ncbi:acyltransferase [Candidatus Pseudomonas adelgestsugas]|uniref:Acyltransferase YihG n=1 Tax=Candidatus Pseudomonas adelgestsugas TaxID=1302376 RepID=A0ABX5R7Y9_9PSED|nr:acyltransferase [Candidatus Pseudomonas adelgestsugas]QAX81762.1 putative acyltransferase YihG [Candidatus Pseudomonas adelgestsugas]
MLDFLPTTVRGIIALLLLALNTILLCSFLFIIALFKALPFAKHFSEWLINCTHEAWITNNKGWMNLVQRTRWHLSGLEGLNYQHSYLVTSNHQSSVDIMVLQYVLNRRIRPLKFFLKQELIWVPIIGLAWWALDFPFMKRYSKAYLEKHPEKQGKDLKTTHKNCVKFRDKPVGIFNFSEGTRFTFSKHTQQKSPFRYLLKPKAGGIAFVLDAMGGQLKSLVNVTIHYPAGCPGYWDLLCGKVKDVVVHFEEVQILTEFIGKNYTRDREYRLALHSWINELWKQKDALLERQHKDFFGSR